MIPLGIVLVTGLAWFEGIVAGPDSRCTLRDDIDDDRR